MSLAEINATTAENLAKIMGLENFLPNHRLNGIKNIFDIVHKSAQSRKPETIKELSTSSWDPRQEEVALLLSGGVDSSVALSLLLDQGYKVRAYYLKIWLEDELKHLNQCPFEEDLRYVTKVCEQFNVPLETLSLQKEYWSTIINYTLAEASAGRTPNPDILCNSKIKFGVFYDYVGR
jgi:3'-phosphoadenosine 5'-phosphosulfate sulfotransferase (PAPS reductase)/FAD synthetase